MPAASDIRDRILAAPNFQARSKRLVRRREAYSRELVAAFARRAHADMRKDPRAACEHARLGLRVADALGHEEDRLLCFRAWAQAATLAGAYRSAARAVAGALEIASTRTSRRVAAELSCMQVQILTHLEQYAAAKRAGRRALEFFEAEGDVKGIFRARMALAELAYRMDLPREALRHYAHVERVLPATVAPRVRGLLAANRANALQSCNRYRAAVRWFNVARAIFDVEGCAHTVAQIDYNLAYSSMLRGLLDEALQKYAAVEKQFTALKDVRHLAHIDLDRSEIYLLLNLPQDALTCAHRAAAGFEQTGVRKEKAQAEYFAGRAAEAAGRLKTAVASLVRAQAGFRSLRLTAPRISCLVQRAYLARRCQRQEEATSLAEEAAALLDRRANPLTVASVELLRANLHLDGGRASEALYTADAAMMRCRHVHAPWLHIEAHRIIGKAHVVRGQSDQAILAYRSAIDELERYRGGVPPDEYMTSFMAARSGLYGDIVDLLVVRGDVDLAFEFAERAKSRALVDLLAGREGGRVAAPKPPSRMRYLRESLNAVYQRLFRPGDAAGIPATRGASGAHQQAGEIEAEIARMLRMRRQEDSEGTSLFTVDAPTLQNIQEELDADSVLVEYFLTKQRLFIFVVTRDSVEVVRQEIEEGEIERRLQRFRFHLAKYERQAVVAEELVLRATRDNLDHLKRLLIDPVKELLVGKRLVVIPHGPLHHLPFHALPWGRTWIADHFEVVYAPSAAVYRYCARRRARAQGPSAVFGVPDEHAPRIAEESRAVAALLGTERLYVSEDATLETLRTVAVDARVLHIATHGVFNRAQPTLSAIRLAQDWVTLYDLYSLDIRGELVVLSTCESGTASVSAGNEILGLTRGCLYAGAPALLCSQWRVHDEVAQVFMTSFYQNLAVLPDAAAAQKAAMADVRRDYPHPYHWAPFFLTGRPVSRTTTLASEQVGNERAGHLMAGRPA